MKFFERIKSLPWKKWIIEFFGILIGTAIMGIALNLFLVPNKLAAGGISGLGIVLYHLYSIPVSLIIIIGNVPIFILGWIVLGRKMVSRSFLGMLILPFMVEAFIFLPNLTEDLLLASLYGGVVFGVGIWMVFRVKSSTGGTALAALILNKISGFPVGQCMLVSDILIIAFAGIVFGLEVAMYAAIALFISSWVIDIIQEGFGITKIAMIISDRSEVIKNSIFDELERGVTIVPIEGGYTGDRRNMLMCVITRAQVSHLKGIVSREDNDAFMIIGNAGETLGEGFIKHEDE